MSTVTVKPLTWHHSAPDPRDYPTWRVRSRLAWWTIKQLDSDRFVLLSCLSTLDEPAHYPTLEAAKAAAQEEWTLFILAALQ